MKIINFDKLKKQFPELEKIRDKCEELLTMQSNCICNYCKITPNFLCGNCRKAHYCDFEDKEVIEVSDDN